MHDFRFVHNTRATTDKSCIPNSDEFKGSAKYWNIKIRWTHIREHILTSLSLVSYKKVANIKESISAEKAQI